MVQAFLGTLASSAGVFLGLLAILLINEIMHYRREEAVLSRERATVRVEREEWQAQQAEFERLAGEIEAAWSRRAEEHANDDLDGFIEDDVDQMIDRPPEKVERGELLSAFAESLGIEDYNDLRDEYIDVFDLRRDEVQAAVALSAAQEFSTGTEGTRFESFEAFAEAFRQNHGIEELFGSTRDALREEYRKRSPPPGTLGARFPDIAGLGASALPIFTPPEVHAARLQTTNLRQLHEERRFAGIQNRLVQARTRARTLRRQEGQLTTALEGLSTRPLRRLLAAIGAGLFLSVVVPVLVFLGTFTDVSLFPSQAAAAGFCFLMWSLGLGVVFYSLHQRITESVDVAT